MNENVALICRGKHFFFNLNFVEPQIHNLTLSSHNPAWWFAFFQPYEHCNHECLLEGWGLVDSQRHMDNAAH